MPKDLWGALFIAAAMMVRACEPVVLAFVNEVPHHLFERSNPALNLAVRFVVVLGGYPYLDS